MKAPNEAERGGGPAVEAAILAGALGLLIAFGVAGARVAAAESATSQAAAAAARIASIQRDPDSAAAPAERAAREALTARGIRCIAVDVRVSTTTDEDLPLVRADISCDAQWSDLGIPGAHRTNATAASPIDTYRERT